MSFASVQFIVFLALVFPAYYLRPSLRWQNGVCVAASYYFFAWWDARFCGLLFLSSVIDYWVGGRLARTERKGYRRALLLISLTANLGLLGFFKYFNFFVDSLVLSLAVIGIDVSTSSLAIVLPIGISFYTFQTLSYTIDIYRGQFKPVRDFLSYLSFVSFFPQLVAGPIERASSLLPQFRQVRQFHYAEAVSGCQLMLWGFFKKLAVADNLARVVDAAYTSPSNASPGHLWLATVCFAFQIYCDFSGYSDIAAGVARWFGINLRRNFAYPYFAQDLSEFWRRWHISLSTWFRDYVFIPLGGSHCERRRRLWNVAVTFLLSGLWHGAAGTFVLWGGLHALYLVPKHWRQPQRNKTPMRSAPNFHGVRRALRIARTFTLVCLGWVLFRSETLYGAMLVYRKIGFEVWTPDVFHQLASTVTNWPGAFIALAILLLIEWFNRKQWNPLECAGWPKAARWAAYTVLFWLTLYFCPAQVEPFIYFQF